MLNIDSETIRHSGSDMIIDNFFNYDPLPQGLTLRSSRKPQYILSDENIIIRALPKLNCQNVSLKDKVDFYPHRIPLVRSGFGSLSYSLFNRENAVNRGVGLSSRSFLL